MQLLSQVSENKVLPFLADLWIIVVCAWLHVFPRSYLGNPNLAVPSSWAPAAVDRCSLTHIERHTALESVGSGSKLGLDAPSPMQLV